MALFRKHGRTVGALDRTSRVLRAEFPYLRSRLPMPWSEADLVASVGRVSEAMIHRDIAEQTIRPEKGRP
jgi:putative transposase